MPTPYIAPRRPVVTAKGTVLAWCEARQGGGDWSDIRILLRRSTDDARTWGAPVLVTADPGYHVMNNARVVCQNGDHSPSPGSVIHRRTPGEKHAGK